MRKAWKTIDNVDIIGNNHWIEILYDNPDDENEETKPYFNYRGRRYFLDEFMNINNKFYMPDHPKFMDGFDGYLNDSFFSGVIIKINPSGDSLKAFDFIGNN